MTIENASDAAQTLLQLRKGMESPVIDLSGVEKIDLSGIQLLISAQKMGAKVKKSIYYTGKLKDGINEKLTGSGFRVVKSTSSDDLYTIRRNSSEI